MLKQKINFYRKDGKYFHKDSGLEVSPEVIFDHAHRISGDKGFYLKDKEPLPTKGIDHQDLSKVALCPEGLIICAASYNFDDGGWHMGEYFNELFDLGCLLTYLQHEDVRTSGWHDNDLCLCGIGKGNKAFDDEFGIDYSEFKELKEPTNPNQLKLF